MPNCTPLPPYHGGCRNTTMWDGVEKRDMSGILDGKIDHEESHLLPHGILPTPGHEKCGIKITCRVPERKNGEFPCNGKNMFDSSHYMTTTPPPPPVHGGFDQKSMPCGVESVENRHFFDGRKSQKFLNLTSRSPPLPSTMVHTNKNPCVKVG